MPTLISKCQNPLGLPTRTRKDERVAGTLAPGGKLEVPEWYVEQLREKRGWRARFDRGEVEIARAAKPEPKGDAKPKPEPKGDAKPKPEPKGDAKPT